MKTYVCDRIEGQYAVMVDDRGACETMLLTRFSRIPEEGDVYSEDLIYDPEMTQKRRKDIASRFQMRKKKGE